MPDGSTMPKAKRAAAAQAPAGATILAGHLLRVVRQAKLATARRNTIPILSCVLLQVNDGRITAISTDLEATSSAAGPASGVLPPVAVPSSRMAALLHNVAPETEVTLRLPDAGSLLIKADTLKARLIAQPAEDFPVIKEMPEHAARFSIQLADLERLITGPAHAISTEETRYYLNGLYLEPEPKHEPPRLNAVATDGHRLAAFHMDMPAGAEVWGGGIVPRGSLAILRNILGGRAAGEIRVTASDKAIEFTGLDWRLH
ncbi:DNA polymerase III subunit beta family protein, partial [Roseomonas elaeocarpi]